MADEILKNIPLPADLPENWTSGQIVAPTGAEAGLNEQHGYNYLMKQVNNAQKALKALAAQREEDLARIRYWVSDNPTSPASFIGGTWERIEDCTIWGASDTHPAGTTVKAGLPNIVGKIDNGLFSDAVKDYAGSLSVANSTSGGRYKDGTSTEHYLRSLTFNASYSDPIYGASTTVQPPAYCMYIWRRVA